MGLNFRKRVLLREDVLKKCEKCKKVYDAECVFCSECGNKLTAEMTKVYANFGKNGITSLTYKMPDGTTINSKGSATITLGNGLSYTTK